MSLSLYWNFDKSVSTIVSTTSSTIFSMKNGVNKRKAEKQEFALRP